MRKLDETDGPARHHRAVRVLALRLKARKDTRDLVPGVVAVRDGLKAAREAYDDAHDERLSGTGEIVFADATEDDLIGDLARRLRVLVDGDLHHPDYRALFDVAPSKATEGVASEEQATLANQVVDAVMTRDAYVSLRDRVPALKAARAEIVAAQAAFTTLEARESRAWNDLQVAETAARNVYNDMEHELALRFPRRPRLVDSFFYKPPRGKKKAAVVEPGDDADEE